MLWERGYPYAGGLLSGVTLLAFWSDIAASLSRFGVDMPQAISVTFDVMVTLTAFLFSVFVLAIAPGGGFLERIFHTGTFRVFRRYVIEALSFGAISGVLCLPFLTTKTGEGVWQISGLLAAWLVFAVVATLSFFRVIHVFMVLVGLDSKERARTRKRAA